MGTQRRQDLLELRDRLNPTEGTMEHVELPNKAELLPTLQQSWPRLA